MTPQSEKEPEKAPEKVNVTVERLDGFNPADLSDICDAAEEAIDKGGGFGWLNAPARPILERYWQGIELMRERILFVARLNRVICGSVQLIRPPRNHEARAHVLQLTGLFVAPWAREHGVGRKLMYRVEAYARSEGFSVINLDVRSTQTSALNLYTEMKYTRWGADPHYAHIDGEWVEGYYYSKKLKDPVQ